MDALYTRAKATARCLLSQYAQGAYTLTRTTKGVIDPEAPWSITTGTAQSWQLDAIGKSVSRQFIDGKTVVATDREVLAAAFGDEPQPGDALLKDGVALTVVRVMPVTDVSIAWRFIVKG